VWQWPGSPVPTITDYRICKPRRHTGQIKTKKPLTQIMSNSKELNRRTLKSKHPNHASRAEATAMLTSKATGSSPSEEPKTTTWKSTSSTLICTTTPKAKKMEGHPRHKINNSKTRIKSKGEMATTSIPMRSLSRLPPMLTRP
jgi:hypothetical protein